MIASPRAGLRPTRRGLVTLTIVVLAVASGSLFGARGLNAIAAPGAVALGFAVVQIWRLDEPTVERDLPRHGTQGSSVTVEFDAVADRPFSARLEETVDQGLEGDGTSRDVTLGNGPITYELGLRRRGERTVGPATIAAKDVLGLVSHTFDVAGTDRILVRPPVYPLSGPRADELVWVFGGGDDRQQFDYLRHYQRGDPLRDIHWRSSAKVPDEDLIVKQFGDDEGATSVRVAAESDRGHDDEMATAAASVAGHLLAAGLRVGLATADADIDPRAGGEQIDRVLDTLARTRGGPLRELDRRRADVLIIADADGVTVELTDVSLPFTEVAGRSLTVPSREPSAGGIIGGLGGMV